jgi:GH24 family phage-related lysozyme (muramidase)
LLCLNGNSLKILKIMAKNKTRWHRLLAALLEQLLTPVGVSVQCDVKVMVNPPEADILGSFAFSVGS